MKENKIIKEVWQYFILILGGLLVGISVGLVLLPVKLSTGGFGGIATILYYLLGLPASIGLVLLNIPVFIITWKVLGFRYSLKSLVGMIACSLGILWGEELGVLTNELMLAALYGGVISGVGIALTYRVGGSTGGTDLIAKLLQVKIPHMNLGELLLIVDGIIIAMLALTFSSIEIALYSAVAVFIMTKILDLILLGASYAKAVFVITNKGDEISEFLHSTINRTTTKIKATGTYTNTEKDILLCVVNKKEIPKLKEGILSIDNKAFTIVTTVTEAMGEGFSKEI